MEINKIFRSKIGLEIAIPITTVLLGVAIMVAYKTTSVSVSILLVGLLVLIGYLLYDTTYQVHNNRLIIRFGFIFKQVIEINEITAIKETNNPLSSPASSLDRLEIKHGKRGMVLISPKEKLEFIETIQSINPNVQIILKKK